MAAKKGTVPATEHLPFYGAKFLRHHAGRVVLEPEVAITELVANSWDAGADRVDIQWPEEAGEELSIADNGRGMSKDELTRRWMTLYYNRLETGLDSVDHLRRWSDILAKA